MTIFVTSDLHFNHAAINDFCDRGFSDVNHMNEYMIERWNAVVGRTDTVWVLGDFGFGHSKMASLGSIFDHLAGHKILVRGNHDARNPHVLKLGWDAQHDLTKIRDNGRRAVVCHYPLETWDGGGRGAIMLHGHSHGNMKRVIPHRYDVGVDSGWGFDFAPIPLDVFFDRAATEEYDPQDHH